MITTLYRLMELQFLSRIRWGTRGDWLSWFLHHKSSGSRTNTFFCIFVNMPGCLDLIQWPVSAQTATTTLQLVSVHSIIGGLPMHFHPLILVGFFYDWYSHQLHQNDKLRKQFLLQPQPRRSAWWLGSLLLSFVPLVRFWSPAFFFVYKYRWLSHTTIQEWLQFMFLLKLCFV